MPIDTDGLIAAELSPDDGSQVMREFESVGLSADLRETPSRRSLQDMACLQYDSHQDHWHSVLDEAEAGRGLPPPG
jgi:hypothetical protein